MPGRTAEDGATRHCDAFVAGVLAYAASRADPVRYDYVSAFGREADDLLAEGVGLGDFGLRAGGSATGARRALW